MRVAGLRVDPAVAVVVVVAVARIGTSTGYRWCVAAATRMTRMPAACAILLVVKNTQACAAALRGQHPSVQLHSPRRRCAVLYRAVKRAANADASGCGLSLRTQARRAAA